VPSATARSTTLRSSRTLSGQRWCYLKVRREEYNSLQAALFADLTVLAAY
jgi:hypothetical protein